MTRPLIQARRLAKRRSGRAIFSDVTFDVEAGSSVAVVGPSGSGKTTLINCLGLLDDVDSGSLEIAGSEVTDLARGARRRLLRSTVGHLFQHYGLVESWSVSRNLDLGFIGQSASRAERDRRRRESLERVGLGSVENHRTHLLSGGEQQRLALARLIVKQPRIIIADEPTAALDPVNAQVVLSVLKEFQAAGCALVIATHDVALESWCDSRVTVGDRVRGPEVSRS
jgi:putative ABC transport system ATP-binding protein